MEEKPESQFIALAWSPDSKLLASSHDRHILIWDMATRAAVRSLVGEAREVVSLDWSRTWALAVARGSGSIEIWDATAGKRTGMPQKSPWRITYEVAWSPDGALLASAEQDSEVRIWKAETRKQLSTLHGHDGGVCTICWSSDGDQLASGGQDSGIILWDTHSGRPLRRLESHVGTVGAVRFSADATLLASKSRQDGMVKVWQSATGNPVLNLAGPPDTHWGLGCSIAFHPSAPILATVDPERAGIDIWQFDPAQLTERPHADTVRYTTARVVLVGDSGVGKTGLGWRLAHGEFREHPSTHGQQFWMLNQLESSRSDGVQCEVVLWDLAGQPDYRLVHALFLDTVDVALLVFDPTSRLDPLAGVEFWLRRLHADTREPPPTILVGARADRGTATLTSAELDRLCEQLGISGGYLLTSAKEGSGLDRLTSRIEELIPWDRMVTTVTTTTFKRMREYVLSLKENVGSTRFVVEVSALRQELEALDPSWHFSDAEMATAIRHLETHGYVRTLHSVSGQQLVLLAPELLSNLASSIVIAARNEPRGLGALDEARLLDGDYRLSELDGFSSTECRLLLDSVVLLFLQKNICFREYLGSRVLLIFPSLINEKRPQTEESSTVDDVSYVVSGEIENVYAALVVLLGYTNTFVRTNQWQNHAQYELGESEICGFRQDYQGDGALELTLYYSQGTPDHVRLLFQGLFETFLTRRSVDVVRHAPVSCSRCREFQDRSALSRYADRRFMFCANCGAKVEIPDSQVMTAAVGSLEQVESEKQIADHRTSFETALVSVKSLLLERGGKVKPTCFISYAWGVPEHERWVLQFAKDLRNADIDVTLDRWHSAPGTNLGHYIDRILNSQFVIVVGTPNLRQKYERAANDPVIAAELELISLRIRQPRRYGHQVIPVLLDGDASESFTPQLQTLVQVNIRDQRAYFTQLFMLIWHLHALPADSPSLETLLSSMTS